MADEQTTVEEQPQSEQTTEQPQNFLDSLPEDLRGEPSLQNFNNVGDMAKSLVHSQKLVGADKIAIPGKHATEEDWQQVYSKLGVPDSADKYDLKYSLAEGVSEQPLKDFIGQAHKLGLLPHQAQGILDHYTNLEQQTRDDYTKQSELAKSQSEQVLRKEFGLKYDEQVNKANNMFKSFFANDMENMILQDGTRLGVHPGFIKSLANLSDKFSEDNLGVGQDESGAMTPQQAENEIAKIMGDTNHPYWKKNHPNHAAAVQEVFQLQNMKEGIKSE